MFDNYSDEYINEEGVAYFAEENEMKLGIHPSQIKESIESWLNSNDVKYEKITFLDWSYGEQKVGVYVDGEFFGVFNYQCNVFETVPI